jgi:hypothetical protein
MDVRKSRVFPAKTASDQGSTGMIQQWETTVPNDEKPNEKARAIRARQRAIGRELRRMYDDVAQEPIPDDFMDLLHKIDKVEESKNGKKVS